MVDCLSHLLWDMLMVSACLGFRSLISTGYHQLEPGRIIGYTVSSIQYTDQPPQGSKVAPLILNPVDLKHTDLVSWLGVKTKTLKMASNPRP